LPAALNLSDSLKLLRLLPIFQRITVLVCIVAILMYFTDSKGVNRQQRCNESWCHSQWRSLLPSIYSSESNRPCTNF